MSFRYDNLSRILAVLCAERGSYSYIDKIGYAPSRDTLLYYLKEALRDFNSLLNSGFESDVVSKEVHKIDYNYAEKELESISNVDPNDRKRLRELSSIISSKALLLAARMKHESINIGGD